MRIERQKTEDRFRAPGPYIHNVSTGLAPWTELPILVFPFNFKFSIQFTLNFKKLPFNLWKLNGNRKGLKKKSRWVDPIFCCEYRF